MKQPPRGNIRTTQRRMTKMTPGISDLKTRQRQSSQSSLLVGLSIAGGIIFLLLAIFILGRPSKKYPIKKAHVGKLRHNKQQLNKNSVFLAKTVKNNDTKKSDNGAGDDSTTIGNDADNDTATNTDVSETGNSESSKYPIEEPFDDDDSMVKIDLQQEMTAIMQLPEYERIGRYTELANRGEEAGLDRKSCQRIYSKILELDPDNLDAREWMGYVRKIGEKWVSAKEASNYGLYNYQGNWLSKEELTSRGLTLHEGKWLSQEEIDKLKIAANAKKPPQKSDLAWLSTIEEGCAQAKEKKTVVFVVVKSKNSHWSQELENNTLNHASFKKYAKQFALVKIDAEQNKKFCEKYKINNFPTILILDDKQKEIKKIRGYKEVMQLTPILKEMLRKVKSGNLRPMGIRKHASKRKTAPELKGMSAIFNDDGRASLAAHRGDLVLLEVYVTTLRACKSAVSRLYKLQKKYEKQGLSIIAFNSTESPEAVARFCLESGPVNYKIFVQAKTVGVYPGDGIVPRCYLIGPQGKILWKGHPDSLSNKKIEKYLRQRSITLNKIFRDAPKKNRNYLIANKKALAYKAAIAAAKKEKNAKKKKAVEELVEFLKEQYDEQFDYAAKLYDNQEYSKSRTILYGLKKKLKGTKYAKKINQKLQQFQDAKIKKQLKELYQIEVYLNNYINPQNGKRPQKKQLQAAVAQLRRLARQKQNSLIGEKASYYADLLEPMEEN